MSDTVLARICAPASEPAPAPMTVLVAAHADDETLGAGGRFPRLKGIRIFHATDGSPRDLSDAHAAGCSTREEYAEARRRELTNVLRLAGIAAASEWLGCVDQEASFALPRLARELARRFAEIRPEVALTLAYEGGHLRITPRRSRCTPPAGCCAAVTSRRPSSSSSGCTARRAGPLSIPTGCGRSISRPRSSTPSASSCAASRPRRGSSGFPALARAVPPGAILLDEIRNGVRVDPHAPPARKKRFALTLGRICPEKAFHLAIDAAALAGVPIAVGGRVFPYPEHEAYWRDEIEPRLSRRASFIGVLGPRAKRRWLSSAQCLVVPSVVEETSSLVAMEAQAAGTPVVAFRLGALEEIVEDGRPGFLVPPADVDGLARGIQRSAEIDPEACRRRARERFDVAETAKRYLDLYARIARADRLAAAGPS